MEKMRQGILVMELEQDRDCKTCYGPSYQLCLLGACAMTLGARIPKRHRKVMREVYRDVGFMRDAVTQLGIALDQDEGYVNGVPWDFGSLGFEDYAAAGGAPEADLLFPGTGMLNVRAPDHKDEEGHPAPWNTLQKSAVELLHKRWDEMTAEQREITLNNLEMTQEEAGKKMVRLRRIKQMWWCLFKILPSLLSFLLSQTSLSRLLTLLPIALQIVNPLIGDFLKMAVDHDMDKTTVANHNTTKVQQFFGDDVCGGCGAKQRNDGSALIQCGKCKKRLYCGRSCQKKDWEKHKKICRKTKKGVAGPSHAKSAQTHTSGQPTSSDEEPFEQYAAYCIRRTSEQSTEK